VDFQVKRMVTRGQRRLGRTIRNLENSVEFSTKESKALESEREYNEKIEQSFDDSPVQDLRRLANRRKSVTSSE
jgi:hypothetical protein